MKYLAILLVFCGCSLPMQFKPNDCISNGVYTFKVLGLNQPKYEENWYYSLLVLDGENLSAIESSQTTDDWMKKNNFTKVECPKEIKNGK